MEDVVYGLINFGEERELARASFGYIKTDISDIKNRYISLGFHLHEALAMKYYQDFGYADFYEFCEKNFQMDKSAVSRSINLWKEFADYDERARSRKIFIDEKYRKYSYSQLCEMLSLDEKKCKSITPDMTVKQIREKKKEWKKKKPLVQDEKSSVATSQPEKPVIAEKKEEAKEETVQQELPLMKNNNQRKEWLENYKDWGLWYRDEHIDVNYYKYDLPDGSRLIVEEYPQREMYWSKEKRDEYFFHLLEKNRQKYDLKSTYDAPYRHTPDNETCLIDFLKKLQKKQYVPVPAVT